MNYPNWFRREDSWPELFQMQRDMNRLFDQFSGQTPRTFPLVNFFTNADGALITTELPGYDPQSIQISVTGDELSIKGDRPKIELKQNECCHRQERPAGMFERRIRLPFPVDTDKVEAKFNNGILTIALTRTEADKPKKIQIKTN